MIDSKLIDSTGGKIMSNKNKQLVTAKEVMEFLGVSRKTLYRYKMEKGLPEYKINKTTSRYDMNEIKAWLNQMLIANEPTSDFEFRTLKKKQG